MNTKRVMVILSSLSALIVALLFLFNPDQASRAATLTTWTLDFDSTNSEMNRLAVYNGNLYASSHTVGQVNGKLYSFDGTTWIDTDFASVIGVTIDQVQALQVFNERLYIGTRVDVSGVKYMRVYYYDGTTFTEDISRTGQSGYAGIWDFAIHNNALYAMNSSMVGEVYQRVADNNWITVGGGAVDPSSWVSALASYNGSLYAGTGAIGYNPKVYRWTGTTWELVIDFYTQFGVRDAVASLRAFDGYLYASLAGSNPPKIYVFDGSDWSLSASFSGVCGQSNLEIVDGQLWAGTCNGDVYRLGSIEWESMGTTGEITAVDFVRYMDRIYVATCNNGRIYYTEAESSINLSIVPPTSANVGDLVYVPVSLSEVNTSDDVRGVQFGVRVSDHNALAPADDQPLRMGDLFSTDSFTYTAIITNGWDFMLTTPFSPTPPVSGTGIIVELPFYAQAEGCVNLTFTDHILTNSNAITISHQTSTGQICLIPAFQPDPNGYHFPNADGFATWDIFRDIFGTENVEHIVNGQTIRDPIAEAYFKEHYECSSISYLLGQCKGRIGIGGNCLGMNTSSLALWRGWTSFPVQGITETIQLPVPAYRGWPLDAYHVWQSTSVADFIVRHQGYWYGREIQSSLIQGAGRTLTATLNLITSSIDGGMTTPYALAIYGLTQGRCYGHALTPYRHQQVGVSTRVYVYDSNHPYSTSQHIELSFR